MQVKPAGGLEAFASGACGLRSAQERPSAEEAARCITAPKPAQAGPSWTWWLTQTLQHRLTQTLQHRLTQL